MLGVHVSAYQGTIRGPGEVAWEGEYGSWRPGQEVGQMGGASGRTIYHVFRVIFSREVRSRPDNRGAS